MPRTALTVQTSTRDGMAPAYDAADSVNDHEFANDSQNIILHVKNAGGATTTLTFITPGTVDGQDIGDRVVTVPAAGERFIGPFSNSQYGSGTASRTVYFDIDVATSVTILALALGTA